jgi:translation initiation factor IF-3
VKVRKAREFLAKHDKVKVNVLFRGRENAHHDRGRELLQQFIDLLEGEVVIEQAPRMESGRAMSTILAPAS